MDNWRNDICDAAEALGVNITGNWRNDVHAIAEAIISGGTGGSTGGITSAEAQQLINSSLEEYQVETSNIANGSVTSEKLDASVTSLIPKPLVATLCAATTVNFKFSDDGNTFSFTGGSFLWMSTKGEYGVATFGAQINIPYVSGRVIVMDVSNPSSPTVLSRAVGSSVTFSDSEYVIGNMFDTNSNPISKTVTVYGSGAYGWSDIGGTHEAYGDISTEGATIELAIGDYTVIANGGTTASVAIKATYSDIPNVDISKVSLHDGASDSTSFDDVTLSATTPLEIDSGILLESNDTFIIWIGNGKTFIEVKVFISASGQRCRISSSYLSA